MFRDLQGTHLLREMLGSHGEEARRSLQDLQDVREAVWRAGNYTRP